jgi:hypothetical protein
VAPRLLYGPLMRISTLTVCATLVASVMASAAACTTGSPAEPAASDSTASVQPVPPSTFHPDSPYVYVAKVKNVLVGLPPTDAEVKQVVADPSALKSLIQTWMTSSEFAPLYQQKMQRFFELAFQQTQIAVTDLQDQSYPRADDNPWTAPEFMQNIEQSFARTMVSFMLAGTPLTEAMTTDSLMMTPALMEYYAFLDALEVTDDGLPYDYFAHAYPNQSITIQYAGGPVALADSVTPGGKNFMTWYYPALPAAQAFETKKVGDCNTDPIVLPARASTLHLLLLGGIDEYNPAGEPEGPNCFPYGPTLYDAPVANASAQLTATDFTTWKMVKIRRPNPGETPTWFYDLPTLRTAAELVLRVPRVGFFTTPAFFANWQTNTSNTMRVTMNQALIVATGAAVDGTDTTVPPSTPGLDAAHAAPGSACYGCHKLLDPTRSILSATYSVFYKTQTTASLIDQPGLFAFQGVINTKIHDVTDLASTLATHPLVAAAWATKLCYYVNSYECQSTDPEFQRIVDDFKAKNFNWNSLVAEMLASPLTTYASPTESATRNAYVVAVSRRDHLCAALNARLGFTDVCALSAMTPTPPGAVVPDIVAGLPSDGYGRGAVAPVLPNQPTLFYRAGTENICEQIASEVIDTPAATLAELKKANPGLKQWSSSDPQTAISDFVGTLMGLVPSDPRSAKAQAMLESHFTQASAMTNATEALQSTFITACLAPTAVSIGL